MKYNFIKISVYILVIIVVIFLVNYLMGLFKNKTQGAVITNTIDSDIQPLVERKIIDGVPMIRYKFSEEKGWGEWEENN